MFLFFFQKVRLFLITGIQRILFILILYSTHAKGSTPCKLGTVLLEAQLLLEVSPLAPLGMRVIASDWDVIIIR